MAINSNIITDTAKDATKRTVVDYGAGVFAHTTQDWSQHTSVLVYFRPPFLASGETVTTETLRLVATLDDGSALGQDLVLAVPINPSGFSAITNSPPIIIQQPSNKVVPPNATVQIIVAAISDIPVTYQWQKKNASNVFVALSGKTATSLVLTDVTTADTGDYRVVVTNANGSTTSDSANILVSAGASGQLGSEGFLEMLPGVRLFNFLSDLF